MSLASKVEEAKQRIRTAIYEADGILVGHSGGKDSCVIMHLANTIYRPIAVHTVKELKSPFLSPQEQLTEVHPKTLEFMYTHVAKENVLMFVPKDQMQDFFALNEITHQLDGSRKYEAKRTTKSDNFVVDGETVSRTELTEKTENGLFGMTLVHPIFDWTDQDVWNYIFKYNVPVSEEYIESGELESFVN